MTCCTAAATTFPTLLVCRMLLGAFEATILPSFVSVSHLLSYCADHALGTHHTSKLSKRPCQLLTRKKMWWIRREQVGVWGCRVFADLSQSYRTIAYQVRCSCPPRVAHLC